MHLIFYSLSSWFSARIPLISFLLGHSICSFQICNSMHRFGAGSSAKSIERQCKGVLKKCREAGKDRFSSPFVLMLFPIQYIFRYTIRKLIFITLLDAVALALPPSFNGDPNLSALTIGLFPRSSNDPVRILEQARSDQAIFT